jgi:hypothetical protein
MQWTAKRSREQWREYFPYRPDDMPPKSGDKAALKRILADPEIERECIGDLLRQLIN